jgi:hypothetical protein
VPRNLNYHFLPVEAAERERGRKSQRENLLLIHGGRFIANVVIAYDSSTPPPFLISSAPFRLAHPTFPFSILANAFFSLFFSMPSLSFSLFYVPSFLHRFSCVCLLSPFSLRFFQSCFFFLPSLLLGISFFFTLPPAALLLILPSFFHHFFFLHSSSCSYSSSLLLLITCLAPSSSS